MGDRVQDVHKLIERLTSSERLRSSSHFTDAVYHDEPIITTGRQMANYLPDRYREMHAISRWQEGTPHGRWLSEAELFYRQGIFMADYEDDCPYHGTFKAYFPTYSAMSDRQLRGYFTWRAAVRRGDIQETSLSFAYVYLYELINGIGVTDAQDGFRRLKTFWEAYRVFAPEIDRYVRVWLRDYVVYHELDPELIGDSRSLTFDRALVELITESLPYDPAVQRLLTGERIDSPTDSNKTVKAAHSTQRSRKRKAPAISLPPDREREARLLAAIDGLSTYRIRLSRLYHDAPDDLRHVACAVFVRTLEYYRKHRKNGLIETLFGERATMPYTMFASAVFYEPEQHRPADYALDDIHSYRCRNGMWTCTRVFGARDKSSELGSIMRAVDRKLREALDYPHQLKPKDIPKYLDQMIDKEIEAWLSWKQAHAPRRIAIDMSQLAGIRSAAASTREALLTDEERADVGTGSMGATAEMDTARSIEANTADAGGADMGHQTESDAERAIDADAERLIETDAKHDVQAHGEHAPEAERAGATEASTASKAEKDTEQTPEITAETPASAERAPLTQAQAAFARALLTGDDAARTAAVRESAMSEDMLVDAINEALFDAVGDTVIEFGAAGPQIIEDYEDIVKDVLT